MIKSQSLVSRVLVEESSKLFDTLNNNTLTLALASTIRFIIRSTIVRDKFSKRVSTRFKILKIYYNLILNSLALLIKINAFKFYKS